MVIITCCIHVNTIMVCGDYICCIHVNTIMICGDNTCCIHVNTIMICGDYYVLYTCKYYYGMW